MTYVILAAAIITEVIATTLLKLSEGFTKPLPSIGSFVGYGISLYLLSLTLRSLPTGISYAIWSGVGTVLIVLISWIFMGQKLDMPAVAGVTLIVAGVIVINLFSTMGSH